MSQQSDFFVAGGTLRTNTPSYVTRPADQELFERVLVGEFCYVLTSRQMGKSSLMVRTAQHLKDQGCMTVIVDLTSIGTDRVSVDEWYLGLLTRIRRDLRLETDVQAWWQEHEYIGAPQRLMEFMRNVVLVEVVERIAIFIDELDSTLNLDFRDDFFAAIRAMYNARASEPSYNRLTFVLLGVATPTDLIQDRDRTPFNIGRRIVLQEFSDADALVLKKGLEDCHTGQGDLILARIFFWTNGHPYLTQKICLAAAHTPGQAWDDEKVDALVEMNFFSEEARKDTNLMFVQDRIRARPPAERRRMLQLYSQVYSEKSVPDDDRSPLQNYLELFGLVRVVKGTLCVRNEIYRRIFNQDWIKVNTPANRPWIIAGVASVIVLVLVALATFLLLFSQTQTAANVQAENYRRSFLADSSSTTRMEALAGLFSLGPEYHQQALQLFYDLTPEEQQNLFLNADAPVLGSKVVTVVGGVYTTLDTLPNNDDRLLMEAMIAALKLSQQSGTDKLIAEINNWKIGRVLVARKQYQDAIEAYSAAVSLNRNNPVLHYDRAVARSMLERYDEALADLDDMVCIAAMTATVSTPVPALSPTSMPSVATPASCPSDASTPITVTQVLSLSSPNTVTRLTVNLITSTTIVTPISTPPCTAPPLDSPQRFLNVDQIKNTVARTICNNEVLRSHLLVNLTKFPRLAAIISVQMPSTPTETSTPALGTMVQQMVEATLTGIAQATEAAETQTAIALTPATTATPSATSIRPTNTPRPKNSPGPTNTSQPPSTPPSGVVSIGNGDLFKGSARQGADISPDVSEGGSCIQGTVKADDGSLFNSFYVQVDNHGHTIPAKHFFDTGNYKICGLGAGEWDVAVYAVNNIPTSDTERHAHQVRIRLTGRPGEIFYVDFRGKLEPEPPTPTPAPPADTPIPTPSPYDGLWAGTLSGQTTTGAFTGNFRMEVRNNAIYRISIDGPPCLFETYPNFPNGVPIAGNAFSFGGKPFNPVTGPSDEPSFNVYGEFSSPSRASGSLQAIQGGISCIDSNWSASK